jgi:hypothetical protein
MLAIKQSVTRFIIHRCRVVVVLRGALLQVLQDAHGDKSSELCQHFQAIAQVLSQLGKSNRAESIAKQAISMRTSLAECPSACTWTRLDLACAYVVHSRHRWRECDYEGAAHQAGMAHEICARELWPPQLTGSDVDSLRKAAVECWTEKDLEHLHQSSSNARRITSSFMLKGVRLKNYKWRRAAAEMASALIAMSNACLPSDIYAATMAAANAHLCSSLGTPKGGILEVLSRAQLCICAVRAMIRAVIPNEAELCTWFLRPAAIAGHLQDRLDTCFAHYCLQNAGRDLYQAAVRGEGALREHVDEQWASVDVLRVFHAVSRKWRSKSGKREVSDVSNVLETDLNECISTLRVHRLDHWETLHQSMLCIAYVHELKVRIGAFQNILTTWNGGEILTDAGEPRGCREMSESSRGRHGNVRIVTIDQS